MLKWASDGKALDIREMNKDDTTPELSDVDGDHVLDLISGGRNGRVFKMKGVGHPTLLADLRALMKSHSATFAMDLKDNSQLRERVFGLLASLQSDLASGVIPISSRESIFSELASIAMQHPGLVHRAKFDLQTEAYMPFFAGQFWTVLLESLPDSRINRERVSKALGFAGGYQTLLVDFGIIFIDNDTATSEQLLVIHEFISTLPHTLWEVEVITVRGWLGPAAKTQSIQSRTGVNIFDLNLGVPENSIS